MPYIDACNIACGGHAGNHESMSRVVILAKKHQVAVGAHPSYPDRENFGRQSMMIDRKALITSIQNQVKALEVIVKDHGLILSHIKPHGALYNDMYNDKPLSATFLEAVRPWKKLLKIVLPHTAVVSTLAIEQDFSVWYEAFGDRNYHSDLSLVGRSEKHAVISNPDQVWQHIKTMIDHNWVTTVDGQKKEITADTFCIHGDNPRVIEILHYLSQIRPTLTNHDSKT